MATAKLMPISELKDKKFFIKSYQRGYRWDKVQIDELFSDLIAFRQLKQDNTKDENCYYCLQPVMVQDCGDGFWELIDGQQRLTSLWLMSAICYLFHGDRRIKYQLKYQKKEKFTELFAYIESLLDKMYSKNAKIHGTEFLKDLRIKEGDSIDCRYLIDRVQNILEYTPKSGESVPEALYTIFNSQVMLQSIKIIWYELDTKEDAIQTFTDINANKIELTNAELIKAMLLHSVSEDTATSIAFQWEEIEKGLNNERFWGFISNSNKYATRIEYLFEIWYKASQKKNDDSQNINGDDDRHALFRKFSDVVAKNNSICEDIWREIQKVYETLMDWYNNDFYYHTIGLLVVLNQEQAKLISQLYTDYSCKVKTDFKDYILRKIRDHYFSQSANDNTPFKDKDTLEDSLRAMSYQDNKIDVVKNVLLLYNIAMLINSENMYERFPFDLYKKKTWDIEHINPQTPPREIKEEEKKEWLQSYYKFVIGSTESSEVINKLKIDYREKYSSNLEIDIKNAINGPNRSNRFEQISKFINDNLGIGDIDSLGNLVLLDSGDNRSYKNACFSDKRAQIIDKVRGKRDKDRDKPAYIPIGTKWVFLKGYQEANSFIIWSAEDRDAYFRDMTESIEMMLKEVLDK